MKHAIKRPLALLLCLILCLGMLPGTALAVQPESSEEQMQCHDALCSVHCSDADHTDHCHDEQCTENCVECLTKSGPEEGGLLAARIPTAEPDATTKLCPDCRTRMTLQTEEPDCEYDGYTYYECANCGYYEEVDTISALGHDYQPVVHEDATCMDWGYTYYECTRCEEGYDVEDEEPTGIHEWEYQDETSFPEGGYREVFYTCAVCEAEKTEQVVFEGICIVLDWEDDLDLDLYLERNGIAYASAIGEEKPEVMVIDGPENGQYVLRWENCSSDFFSSTSTVTARVFQDGVLMASYTIPATMNWTNVWYVCSFDVVDGVCGNFQAMPNDDIYLVLDYIPNEDAWGYELDVEVYQDGNLQSLPNVYAEESVYSQVETGRVGTVVTVPATMSGEIEVRVGTDGSWTDFADCSARLRVYQNGELLGSYFAPTDLQGSVWEVVRFFITDGAVENLTELSHNYVAEHYEPDYCDEYGWTIYTCANCGDSYETDDDEPIGHAYELTGYKELVCGEDGTALYVCRRCGTSRAEPVSGSSAHNYVETYRQEPMHEVSGFVIYTCANCGVSYTETTDALSGHDYELTSYVEPTCTDWGEKTYTCRICGNSYQERVQPTNSHTYYLESSVPATCTEYGTDHYVCKDCGRSYDTHSNPSGEHSYELVYHRDASCSERGWNEYRCKTCDRSYRDYIAVTGQHRYYVESEKQPFGDENGSITYCCSGCGSTYTTRIAANGEELVDENGHFYYLEHHTEPSCMSWGESHCVCAICGEEYSLYHAPTEVHTYTSYEHQDPRCTCEDGQNQAVDRWGYTTRICRDCVWSVWEWEEPSHEHSYYLAYHQEPTCIDWGFDTYRCQSCGDEYRDYADYAPTGEHTLYFSAYEFETCTTGGAKFYDCKDCDWHEEEYIAPTGAHRYELVETVEASEDQYGWELWRCLDCSGEKRVYLPPTENTLLAHSGHMMSVVSRGEADCGDFGWVQFYCEDCGEWYMVQTAPPTGEHDWVLSDSGEPGCEYYSWYHGHAWGWETWCCEQCGETYTVDVTTPTHQHNWEITDQHEPGCSDSDYGYINYFCSDCQKSYVVYTPPTDEHDWYAYEVYDGDCDEWGYTTYRCWDCGAMYTVDQVPPTDIHNLYVFEHQDSSCQGWGYDEYRCWDCDYSYYNIWNVSYRMMIPPTGEHEYQLIEHQDAACEDNGWDYYECSTCDRWKEITIPALGHDYHEVARVEPQNEQDGSVRYECTRCDSSYTEVLPRDHTHEAGDAVIENVYGADCTSGGSYDLVSYCTICHQELSRETVTTSPLGHSYEESSRVEPTNGQPGYIRWTCSRCGYWYDEELPASSAHDIRIVLTWGQTPRDLDSHMYIYDSAEEARNSQGESVFEYHGNRGHTAYYSKQYYENGRLAADLDHDDVTSYGPETTTIYAPLADGVYLFKVHDFTNRSNYASRGLSNSGATVALYIGDEPWLDATGNPYVFHVPEDRIGCTWEVFYITVETETVTVVNRLDDHDWDDGVYYPASCEQGGYTLFTCRDCGTVRTEADNNAPALGHNYVETGRVQPTNTSDGYVTYTCSRCGNSYREILPAPTHNYVETAREEPTCTAAGYIEYTCTDHGETMRQVLQPIGHSYQVSRVVEPTCTEDGYTEYRCVNCGDSYSADFVDALDHNYVNGSCTRCGESDPRNPRLILTSTTGCEGSVITIPITLERNPGIASMRLLIRYDRDVLELQSAALSDAFRTAPGVQYVMNTAAYPAVLNWMMLTGEFTETGVFATLTFKVLSADAGSTVVEANYEQADVYNEDMEDVTFDVVNSTVTLGVHNLIHVAGTSADCTTAGEREHWDCGVCGKSFADEAATVELSESEMVIPALGHILSEPVTENSADATCTTNGSYDSVVYCSRCHTEQSRETVIVPALGHDYDYYTGVCTRCDAQDPTFPTENTPTFRIVPVSGIVGREVVVTLRLENNPGLSSAKLTLHYDTTKLTYQSAAMTELSNVQGANFSAVQGEDGLTLNYLLTNGALNGDGDFIQVTFQIQAEAEAGNTPLRVSYQRENVFNAAGESIRFYCANANLLVKLRVPGDVNGDGLVNNKDARLLFQYVSNIVPSLTFYTDAADVNGDGRINNKDARLLFQFVSGMNVVLV